MAQPFQTGFPMSNEQLFTDAWTPREIAQRVATMGVAKARASALTLLVLALLACAFISLGALFYTFVSSGSSLGFGVTRLLGGLSFSLGLILVVIAGAELFTGNNLLAMAWASRLITTREVLRNWLIVYTGNVLGCLGTVVLVYWSDLAALNNGAIGDSILDIANAKGRLSTLAAFARGVLCNVLVCLAVWLAMGGHSVTDKILAVMLPVAAFVTLGLEHSIANWFYLPYGLLLDSNDTLTMTAALHNLLVVTAGNIAGGTLLVAGIYWLAYLRGDKGQASST
jgi:formate transporter